MRAWWAIPGLATVAGLIWAGTAGPERQPAPAPFKLELNKPIEIVCTTKSVVVATDAAKASNGEIKLSLLLKDAAAKPPSGSWRIVSADRSHGGSFAAPLHHGKSCAEACPLRMAADDQIQLWSPAPKGVDQLADKEILLLAVVKTKTLDLRASTFNGRQIEALEEGTCRMDTK